MPIIFHFHPGEHNDPDSHGDPQAKPSIQLKPVDAERFASPLILRPLAEGQQYFLGVLVLSSTLPAAVLQVGKVPKPVNCTLTPGEAAQIAVLRDSRGTLHTDPIARFLAEIER